MKSRLELYPDRIQCVSSQDTPQNAAATTNTGLVTDLLFDPLYIKDI